ncbi:tetratricopeptide repeat protein [Kitasatospora herbaricolor]|uniref:tetratricopeptide repeat protein n=1 Tax=Kitasatospora herbaricolor TaxID=68217 RepID=UPI0036DC49C3
MTNSTLLGSVLQLSDIGGDVHITTCHGAEPPYRVAALHLGHRRPTTAQARSQPARLLQAGHALVDFTGRRQELDRLAAWRDAAGASSVLLLHGTGGQGKTRLAAHFAAACRTDGWAVLQARHISDPVAAPDAVPDAGHPGRAAEPGADGAGSAPAGLLMVVDYAERWPATDLLTLLTRSAAPGIPTRVLLVSRPAGLWWQTLGNRLDRLDLDATELPLPPLTDDPGGAPEALFAAARDAFAVALDVTDARRLAPPAVLQDRGRFGQVLAVHMAALAAVDAHRLGDSRTVLGSPRQISAYLLNRERDHWRTLHENRRVTATVETLARSAYTAALTGALDRTAGHAALTQVRACPDGTADQALDDHAVPYPPADPHAATVLEPLYPDRLAEAYLALSTPGHRHTWFTPDSWAGTAPQALLRPGPTSTDGPSAADGPAPGWARRALTVLIAAATDWPHLVPAQLVPLLTDRPELALLAGGAALGALAALENVPLEVLEAVYARLPEGRHAELDPGIAALCARLTPHRLAATTDPAEQARLHSTLGARYANAGDHAKALVADEQALALRRPLAATDRAAHEADLADSLNTMSVRYGAVGQHAAGLAAGQEAVAVLLRLALADAVAHGPALADALNNLSIRYGDVGRRTEGLAAVEAALGLRRLLAEADPAAHRVAYASALNNVSVDYGRLGRYEDGLAAAEAAVAVRRELAAADSGAHEVDLAGSLNNLSTLYDALGHHAESLTAIEEAVTLLRPLAAVNPAAHEADLATALNNLSNRYGTLDRPAEGLAAIEQAVGIRRRQAAANPAAHEADLANSLNNLALRQDALGRQAESLATVEEAVTVLRRLATANPAAHEADLSTVLNNLSNGYGALGRTAEAVAAGEEAVLVRRRLAAAYPAAHQARLAASLQNLSAWFAAAGRPEEGLAAIEEAVEIGRRQAAANPAAHEADLAGSLNNLSVRYGEVGRTAQSLAAIEEAVEIRRRQAAANPAAHEPGLANSLVNLAVRHGESGRTAKSRSAVGEALALHRRLAAANPAAHESDLARALWVAAQTDADAGYDLPGTLRLTVEAAEIYTRLASKDPTVHGRRARAVGELLADLLDHAGRTGEADGIREVIALLPPAD